LSNTGIFTRLAKNVGWLLGSRGFAAVASIGYLAIAARSLGPKNFGVFTVVLTYGQLIANLVQFQSFKSIIRYGSLHLARGSVGRLGRLTGLTATIDFTGAIVGAIAAILLAPLVAPFLQWNIDQQHYAQLFAAVLLVTTGATPSGILRLFDRFDMIAYTDAISPAVRLLGSAIVWLTGASLVAFLLVWALSSVVQVLSQWVAALRIQSVPPRFGIRPFRRAVRENPRILKFVVQTNLSSSLSSSSQMGILAVGALAGSVQAGGFRIAERLAKGITNPAETVTRALYPEFARLVAQHDYPKHRHVLLRVCFIGAGLGALAVLIVGPAAREILRAVAGPHFTFAQPYLVLLLIAAAVDLAGFALEPFHNAHGRVGRVLRIRAVGAATYLLLLGVLIPQVGAAGAALAAVGASLVTFVQFALSSRQMLSKSLAQARR
jgi:O-antigen/teichoic acid export membrane protein